MFVYTPGFIPAKFVVVGAGGTGSRLIPLLAQYVSTLDWIPGLSISVFDPDTVEQKNLVRQNFIAADVGKYKAEVLATRYGRAYNVPIYFHNKEFPRGVTTASTVFFLCVDSFSARKEIINNMSQTTYTNLLIVDAGNKNDYGQVSVYNPAISAYKPGGVSLSDYPDATFDEVKIESLPVPGHTYLSMASQSNSPVSCAEIDQTLAINSIMASTMMGIVQLFVSGQDFRFNQINVGLTYSNFQYLTPRKVAYDIEGQDLLQRQHTLFRQHDYAIGPLLERELEKQSDPAS